MKTIADLTDEQLLHIAELAYGGIKPDHIVEDFKAIYTPFISEHYEDAWERWNVTFTALAMGTKTASFEFILSASLGTVLYWVWDDEKRMASTQNQYAIYEYLRELNIKPVAQ